MAAEPRRAAPCSPPQPGGQTKPRPAHAAEPDSAVPGCDARAPPAAWAAAGGARANPPGATRPGVPERRGGVVARPRRDGRVPRTDGRWPRSWSRGGRGRPRQAEGGLVRRPPRSPPGRGRAGRAPAPPSAPRAGARELGGALGVSPARAPGRPVAPSPRRPGGRRTRGGGSTPRRAPRRGAAPRAATPAAARKLPG